MDDMNALLTRAATAHPLTPGSPGLVDADLARGRQALHRRRLRRGGVRTALVALAAVGTVAVLQPHAVAPRVPSASPSAERQSTAGTRTLPAISLVAYTGTQPDGYTVDSVPEGWEIQGVNNYALVIAPKGSADQSLDSFENKLVVMLISKDATVPTTGPVVAVGSHTGRISHFDTTAQLFFSDGAGHTLDVQVPPALHWTDQQIGQFGVAVHANATAVAGVG